MNLYRYLLNTPYTPYEMLDLCMYDDFYEYNSTDEKLMMRIASEVPNWPVWKGNFYGESFLMPENILISCLYSASGKEWISNRDVVFTQAKQEKFMIEAFRMFGEELLNMKDILFVISHNVIKSDEFRTAIANYGTQILFEVDGFGNTFLYDKYLDPDTITVLFHALGRDEFKRLVLNKNRSGKHFGFGFVQSSETILKALELLPEKSIPLFITPSFLKTQNGMYREVVKFARKNGCDSLPDTKLFPIVYLNDEK